MQQTLLTGGALFTSALPASASSPLKGNMPEEKIFKLNYAIHDGMFKNNAGDDFIEQIKFAHSAGFRDRKSVV